MAKTIITAALTGAVTPAGYKIPETPQQIADEAYDAWKLGAAVVHLHMRDDGLGAMDKEKFRETIRLIRSHKDCDVIINCTSSGASPEHPATDDERMAHHRELPGIEMGSYDAGSFNWMPGGVFVNSPQFLEKLGDLYMEKGIKPELEIFDAGMLGVASYFVKKGHLSPPCHYQFCLGVLGGMAVPAVQRFGYGFVQGADAAAVEMGIADQVVMEYVYGNQFFGDSDITAYMDNWYQTLGVEVVFASGGGIYTSAAEAAAKVGGKLIGVDVDQSGNINTYGEGMCVTSAMKGLAETVKHMLGEVVAGSFANYGGQVETLGLVSGDDPTANYVQLPMESTQWGDGFTQDDYKALVKAMYDGGVTVSNDISAMPATTITVNFAGNIK